jgi:hypothetical protein
MLVDDGAVLGLRRFAQVNHRPVQRAVRRLTEPELRLRRDTLATSPASCEFITELARRQDTAVNGAPSRRSVHLYLCLVRESIPGRLGWIWAQIQVPVANGRSRNDERPQLELVAERIGASATTGFPAYGIVPDGAIHWLSKLRTVASRSKWWS